ncbi:MAG: LemA family protein [Alphaproteobacteria bacterium]|nr:LemA family protein [Alphaproteobacteria bacterium]
MAKGGSEGNAAEVLDFQAVKRVKDADERLANLYAVEEGEGLEPVGSRTVRTLLVLSLAGILVFVVTLLLRYNTFVILHEEALAKRANLEAALTRRDNLFGNLVKLTLNHAALEHSVFNHAADKRAESVTSGRGTPEALEKLFESSDLGKALGLDGAGLNAALGRLMAIVEQYPNIQSAETYKKMMGSLVDMEDRIALRREESNTSSAIFNTEITKWPWDYLARVTGFDRMEYYQRPADGDTPVITPELFQELLPLAHGKASAK